METILEAFTTAQRIAYGAKIRALAVAETDPAKAEILHLIADNYQTGV